MVCLAPFSRAAQFSVGAILQAGNPGNSDFELGAGPDSSNPASTADNSPFWQDGSSQQFFITYSNPTNTFTVQLDRSGSTTQFATASYTPAGAAPLVNATWIIPTASFFLQALGGPTIATSITVSGLTLTGLNGALNIINPIQQTTFQATRSAGGATSTVAQSSDVVFQGDSTGSWQLSGFLTLTGVNGASRATGNQLAFGVTASATPEPAPAFLSLLGLCAGFSFLQLRKRRVNRGGASG
jgi:hypothetical protein